MNMKLFTATAFVLLSLPLAASAQGVVRGAAEGAHEGNRDAGPVGAVVGGAVGAVSGGVAGLLGVDQRPRFRDLSRMNIAVLMLMTGLWPWARSFPGKA